MRKKTLNRNFFEKPTLTVAKLLLGKYLVRRTGKKIIRGIITEVEAYDGPDDKASHASRGMTERNKVMFGPPGYWYIYFTYGMHWMLNIVTGKEGYPAAVLIRSVAGIAGPARVTKSLKIDKKFNGKIAGRKTGLWFEDRGVRIKKPQIKMDRRVGVDYAGPVWAKKKYRFSYRYGSSRSNIRFSQKRAKTGTALMIEQAMIT